MTNKTLFICIFFFFVSTVWSDTILNPVLPRVADAGVMKYNGRYYIGGVNTHGSFYVSNDLTHWDGPINVITMNNDWATPFGIRNEQIHANDMHYLNGVFHLYWSVNYWGRDRNVVHIAHAVSDNPLGPYREPIKDQWLDNRIDAHLFQDDDGSLYFYMVKFTEGNAIWVRKMKDPATFESGAQLIFSSQPNSWETCDNRVIEGPWVIKYRDRYYMMYNANHTSTQYGNYALGVAEASSPIEFNSGNKYSHPVVRNNQIFLEENYINLLSSDSRQVLDTGIINKTFIYNKSKHGNLSLRLRHSGKAKVWLNDIQIYEKEFADYKHIDLHEFLKHIKEGENRLQIEAQRGRRGSKTDVALFAMKEDKADDILFTPGQPNILRGPNGFEWWLIYMANKNGEPRSQYINRVLFEGTRMTVDGITAVNTQGYHPTPSKPVYQYLTDNNQQPPAINQTIKSIPATNYYFEANIRQQKEIGGNYGIIAWQSDNNNKLTITVDPQKKQWSYTLISKNTADTRTFTLNNDFKAGVYHSIAVYKNGNVFNVLIDNIPAPHNPTIITNFENKGLPGIYSSNSEETEIDGITYTIGWDEYGEHINGWVKKGNLLLKGDKLNNYEFSLQVYNPMLNNQKAEIFPIYKDENSYLSALINFTSQTIIISGKVNGKSINNRELNLVDRRECYVNNVFSDSYERHFTFDGKILCDGIVIPKKAEFMKDTIIENISEKFDYYYVRNGKRYPIQGIKRAEWEHPDFVHLTFAPVEADEFILATKSGLSSSIQKIRLNVLSKESYNLRMVKESGFIHLFLDGKQIFDLKENFGATGVGVDKDTKFDYITLYNK